MTVALRYVALCVLSVSLHGEQRIKKREKFRDELKKMGVAFNNSKTMANIQSRGKRNTTLQLQVECILQFNKMERLVTLL